MGTYAIDHLVLPVAELASARARLSALGFTVAPDGIHPFGTANACVFLSDGTYLEPLAIENRRLAGAVAKKDNTFVARDLKFRGAKNREGLSAVVVATDHAVGDHQRYLERGLSAGPMLEFSRPIKLPDGETSQGSFQLAFAADARVDDFFLFACQRMIAFPADKGELELHSNAVTGLSEVILVDAAPDEHSAVIAEVLGGKVVPETGQVAIGAANGRVRILSPERMEEEFGVPANGATAPFSTRAVIFKSADLAVTEITLAANDVAFIRREGRVLVSPAAGQGVLFGFEE